VEWLKTEQLLKVIGLTSNIYPDLVKVFFTNLEMKEDRMKTRFKGVTMNITSSTWMEVAGIRYSGLKVEKGNIIALENFNKIHFS